MIIIWGQRMYGRVDAVPGLCYVVTRFFHLWYLPLIPLGSFAVVAEQGESFMGASVPLSIKSVLVAWLRCALVVGTIVCLVLTVVHGLHQQWSSLILDMLAAGALVAALVSSYKARFPGHARYERAVELAAVLRITELGRAQLDMQYGRLSPEAFDRLAPELRARQAASSPQAAG
jgi:hypothetical protein